MLGHTDAFEHGEIGSGPFDIGIELRQRRQRIGEARRQYQTADSFGLLAAKEVQQGDAAQAVADEESVFVRLADVLVEGELPRLDGRIAGIGHN